MQRRAPQSGLRSTCLPKPQNLVSPEHSEPSIMYKRFSKQLKMGAVDASSDSESYEEQEEMNNSPLGSESENELADGDALEKSGDSAPSEESDGIIATEQVTVDELEAGDEKVKRKLKKYEVMLYECSICPEKRLTTLAEVKEHIASKVCILLTRHRIEKNDENLFSLTFPDFLAFNDD